MYLQGGGVVDVEGAGVIPLGHHHAAPGGHDLFEVQAHRIHLLRQLRHRAPCPIGRQRRTRETSDGPIGRQRRARKTSDGPIGRQRRARKTSD
eukprot:1229904-Pyramimonas_sp.AAC.1